MPAYKGRKIGFNSQMMILSHLSVFFIPGDFYLDLDIYEPHYFYSKTIYSKFADIFIKCLLNFKRLEKAIIYDETGNFISLTNLMKVIMCFNDKYRTYSWEFGIWSAWFQASLLISSLKLNSWRVCNCDLKLGFKWQLLWLHYVIYIAVFYEMIPIGFR